MPVFSVGDSAANFLPEKLYLDGCIWYNVYALFVYGGWKSCPLIGNVFGMQFRNGIAKMRKANGGTALSPAQILNSKRLEE